MIAYEELEKALARWKTRRSNAPEGQGALEDQAVPEGQSAGEGDSAQGPVTAPVPVDVPRAVHPGYQNPDNTGELDLTDAEVTDA